MGIKSIFSSLLKMFKNSKKNVHIVVFSISFIIVVLFRILKTTLPNDETQMSLLTGVSILASFFLLTLQNINYKYLNQHFNNQVKVLGSRYNKESVIIRSTIFSLAIASFALTGLCFILKLFNIDFSYVLVLLIIYLFVGIIYTIVLWNYFASKDNMNE